jgi:ABC-type amino acid transport substrate-binding protein
MKYLPRVTLSLVLSVLMLLPVSVSVQAEQYVIGVENIEYYPLYAKREGKYAGFARALFDEFAGQSGHKFIYKPLPIKRLFKGFIEGDLDFKFPDSPYWKQDLKKGKKVVYSDSVVEYVDGVLVSPENLGRGKDALKSLGVLRGFTPWDFLDDIKAKKIGLKEVNSLEALIKMTKSKKVDGVYFNVIVANYFQEKTLFDKGGVLFDSSLPHTRSHYYLSTIQHPALIEEFNYFLATNQALVASLKARYGVNLF